VDHGLRLAHQRPQMRRVAGHAVRAGLDEEVPERGRLDRPGQYRQPGRVGRPLAQQRVARTAAHQVHGLDLAARQRARLRDRVPVPERQALQDAADDRASGLKRPIGFGGDAGGHPAGLVASLQPCRVLRGDERRERLRPRGLGGQAFDRVPAPEPLALLDRAPFDMV
jgi:hypothetical protein